MKNLFKSIHDAGFLLANGRQQEAIQQYESALQLVPNRTKSLKGKKNAEELFKPQADLYSYLSLFQFPAFVPLLSLLWFIDFLTITRRGLMTGFQAHFSFFKNKKPGTKAAPGMHLNNLFFW